jgi:hypothetical protein
VPGHVGGTAGWHREAGGVVRHRWLSRDRDGITREVAPRIPARPVAAAPPEPDMPPRPQLRRPDPYLPPVTGGQPLAPEGPVNAEHDPCGAPPIATGKRGRRT